MTSGAAVSPSTRAVTAHTPAPRQQASRGRSSGRAGNGNG